MTRQLSAKFWFPDAVNRKGAVTVFEFSANTGYLWKELPFLERIRETAAHGFDGWNFMTKRKHRPMGTKGCPVRNGPAGLWPQCPHG